MRRTIDYYRTEDKIRETIFSILHNRSEGLRISEIINLSSYLQQFSIQKITFIMNLAPWLVINGKKYHINREVRRIEGHKYPYSFYTIDVEPC